MLLYFFFFKQKTAYEMRISDWSSDVCSSDLTSQRTDLPPPSPRKLTLNQLFARCAALGPSPLPRIFNKRSRVGLNWAAAAMAATPPVICSTVPSFLSCRKCRSEEHTSELQSLMRISYAVFCLKKKKEDTNVHMTILNE